MKERVYLKPGKNTAKEEVCSELQLSSYSSHGADFQHIPACKFHYLAIKNYYYLRHMEWLVYWNCWHRIQAALELSPHSTSEELINAVDPRTIEVCLTFLQKSFLTTYINCRGV